MLLSKGQMIYYVGSILKIRQVRSGFGDQDSDQRTILAIKLNFKRKVTYMEGLDFNNYHFPESQ